MGIVLGLGLGTWLRGLVGLGLVLDIIVETWWWWRLASICRSGKIRHGKRDGTLGQVLP